MEFYSIKTEFNFELEWPKVCKILETTLANVITTGEGNKTLKKGLKGLCHAILVVFLKRLKVSSRQLNSKNNGLALLFKPILRHWNCFLSSVATDGKDGNGLKLEKIGPIFSSFDATFLIKNHQKNYYG